MTNTKETTKRPTKSAEADKPKASIASINARIDHDYVKKFLAFLEDGPSLWDPQHVGQRGMAWGRPKNLLTGAEYTGINVMLAFLSPFSSNEWITEKQLAKLGEKMLANGADPGSLPKLRLDENGKKPEPTMGVFSKATPYQKTVIDAKTGEEKVETRAPRMNAYFRLYNADQLENLPVKAKGMDKPFELVASAEQMMAAMVKQTRLKIILDGGNHYRPSTDEIHLQPKEVWKNEYAFYSTGGHEIIHSTLAPNRLNRVEALGKRWGDQAYAMEELRAEIGALLLSIDLPGMAASDEHIKNHAAYVQSWREALSKDPAELMRAFSDADKCVNYIRETMHEYARAEGVEALIAPPRPAYDNSAKQSKEESAVAGNEANAPKAGIDKPAQASSTPATFPSKPKRREATPVMTA